MRCTISTKIPIKDTHDLSHPYVFSEIDGYIYNEGGLFAVGKYHKQWALVHRPSEEVITAFFAKKGNAEKFLDYFLNELDENEVHLWTPLYSQIREEINKAFEIAYRKYWLSVHRI